MPLSARNLDIFACKLLSMTFYDAVKTNVVLKRIGADDIVVVGIQNTDSNSTRLVDASRDRFENLTETSMFLATIGSKIASGKR